jgi:hypothetical protein
MLELIPAKLALGLNERLSGELDCALAILAIALRARRASGCIIRAFRAT